MEKKVLFGKYETGRILGKGAFAKVYLATNTTSGERVAIKVIKKEEVMKTAALVEQIKREISVMRMVRHPNIVELREVMATRTKIFIVMEYIRGGELFAKVAKGRLSEEAALKYFRQLISAVEFCHGCGVCHRDLKPENLLLDHNGDLKVTDFGLSALLERRLIGDDLLYTQCGTPAYIAPEILRNKGYDGTKVDIWSCGVILYVLLAGFLPFRDSSLTQMSQKIFKADFKFPHWFSPQSKSLISKILVPNPQKRIGIGGIMQHSWFRPKGPFDQIPFGVSIDNDENNQETSVILKTLNNFTRENTGGGGGGGMIKSPSSPAILNAFEFISTISAVDLSKLFENKRRSESIFTSRCSATVIMAKIQLMGKKLEFKVGRVSGSAVVLRGPPPPQLVVTAEVFKVAPEVAVVKFSKNSGDMLEYAKFCDEKLRHSLKDIIWTWHAEDNDILGQQSIEEIYNLQ